MKIKAKKSIILLPVVLIFAWLYRAIMEFDNAISTHEELMQPEITHPKEPIDYVLDAPFYILLLVAVYLLWRIIQANTK